MNPRLCKLDEYRAQRRIIAQRRNARKKAAPGDGVTTVQWAWILWAQDYRCAYCESRVALEMDHVVPLSRGGHHDVTNVVGACAPCNRSKGSKMPDEWKVAV